MTLAVAALVAAAILAATPAEQRYRRQVLPRTSRLASATDPRARSRLLRAVAARVARRSADPSALAHQLVSVSAELRAGGDPATALADAARALPEPLGGALSHAAAAARLGASPSAVLSDVAATAQFSGDTARELAAIAACWSVTEETGAGLAGALERLAQGLLATHRMRAEVRAQLAGPRATASVLAALPLVGLALGAALGAAPLRFLLGGPVGLLCLVAGLGLDVAGMAWTRHLLRHALASC
ncbi:MAG: type II secretion system F family protein [Mycobacteriales bacterium]|nr:type II secretion system F family protein [Frankia sp.]